MRQSRRLLFMCSDQGQDRNLAVLRHGVCSNTVLPCRLYLRHCILAARNLGREVEDNFLDYTFLVCPLQPSHVQGQPALLLLIRGSVSAHLVSQGLAQGK